MRRCTLQRPMNRPGSLLIAAVALVAAAAMAQATHQTVSDGSDHVMPASMRGLGPDQVLVLLNGKRRHPTALIHSTDGFGRRHHGAAHPGPVAHGRRLSHRDPGSRHVLEPAVEQPR